LNVRPALQLTQGAIAWYARHEIRPHHQHYEPCDSGACISFQLRCREGRAREYHPYDGDKARRRRHYRERCRTGPN
jgi:hypothetical protein